VRFSVDPNLSRKLSQCREILTRMSGMSQLQAHGGGVGRKDVYKGRMSRDTVSYRKSEHREVGH